MLTNSYKVVIYEKVETMETLQSTFKKMPYVHFTSDSDNINFIMRLARQELRKLNIENWNIGIIHIYDYQSGTYEPLKVITKPFKNKITASV